MNGNSGRLLRVDELATQARARKGTAAAQSVIDAMASETQRALASVGLAHAQFVLLLAVNELEPIAVQTLERILVVGASRAQAELDRLYEKGVLCEQTDRDAVVVSTTAHGRALLQRAVPLWEAAQARIRRSMLSDDSGRDMLDAAKKPAFG